MINFAEYLEEELQNQRQLLKQCQKSLRRTPEGYLRIRRRKKGMAFYVRGIGGSRAYEKPITEDISEIQKLFQKRIDSETLVRARRNIEALEALQAVYKPNDYTSIADGLPNVYRETARFLCGQSGMEPDTCKPIQHCYNPDSHFHETVCGLLVRSKSEVIIANALTSYGIPFDYERQFPYPDDQGFALRPDFTFDLPNGETRIWEHLGLMKRTDYSERTGRKLMIYQRYGYLIGRELILTQDNEKGSCSSGFIDEVIRKNLLPYFR